MSLSRRWSLPKSHAHHEEYECAQSLWFPLCYDSTTLTNFDDLLKDANLVPVQIGNMPDRENIRAKEVDPERNDELGPLGGFRSHQHHRIAKVEQQLDKEQLQQQAQEKAREMRQELNRVQRWFDDPYSVLSKCSEAACFWNTTEYSLSALGAWFGRTLAKTVRPRKTPMPSRLNSEAQPLIVTLSACSTMAGLYRFALVVNPFTRSLAPNLSLFFAKEESIALLLCDSLCTPLIASHDDDEILYVSYVSRRPREYERGRRATVSEDRDHEHKQLTLMLPKLTAGSPSPVITGEKERVFLSPRSPLTPGPERDGRRPRDRDWEHRASYSHMAPLNLSPTEASQSTRYVSFCDMLVDRPPQFIRDGEFQVQIPQEERKKSKWNATKNRKASSTELLKSPSQDSLGSVPISAPSPSASQLTVDTGREKSPLRVYTDYTGLVQQLAASNALALDGFRVHQSYPTSLTVSDLPVANSTRV